MSTDSSPVSTKKDLPTQESTILFPLDTLGQVDHAPDLLSTTLNCVLSCVLGSPECSYAFYKLLWSSDLPRINTKIFFRDCRIVCIMFFHYKRFNNATGGSQKCSYTFYLFYGHTSLSTWP